MMAEEKPEEGMQRIEVNMPVAPDAPQEEPPAEETPAEEVIPPAETPDVPAEEETPVEEAPAEEAPVEEPAPEIPEEVPVEEPAPEPAPPRRMEIPDDVKRVASFGHTAAIAMQRNPALYKMYLSQLKADGIKLNDQDEALLSEAQAPAQAQEEKYEDVISKAKKMILEGRDVEASDVLAKWHSDNATRELRSQFEAVKAETKMTKAQMEKERSDDHRRQAEVQVKGTFRALVTQFPQLFMVDPDPKSFTGIHSKDTAFLSAFYKNVEELGPKVTLDRAVKVTLIDLGRALPKPKGTPIQSSPGKPAPKPAAPKLSGLSVPDKKPDWKTGMQRVQVEVQQGK